MQEHLFVLRNALRISQGELAQMVGISRQTLAAVERQKRELSWNVFLALVLVFMKNPSTELLLSTYEIFTDELNDYLMLR